MALLGITTVLHRGRCFIVTTLWAPHTSAARCEVLGALIIDLYGITIAHEASWALDALGTGLTQVVHSVVSISALDLGVLADRAVSIEAAYSKSVSTHSGSRVLCDSVGSECERHCVDNSALVACRARETPSLTNHVIVSAISTRLSITANAVETDGTDLAFWLWLRFTFQAIPSI